MKFLNLKISNFRAIEFLELGELGDIVLIAGQNGVGKSCIFDSIRLLKSSYGGYHQNEINNWYSEFQLNIGNALGIEGILRDKKKPIEISAHITLADSEIKYLKENKELLIKKKLLEIYTNGQYPSFQEFSIPDITFQNAYSDRISEETDKYLLQFEENIERNNFFVSLELMPNGDINFTDNIVIQLLFSNYNPVKLGIIDYHGAHRSYQKENIQNLNVNFTKDINNQFEHSTLYNYNNKYNNVKTELASSYIKALISKESGLNENEPLVDLNKTLSSLFDNFFPGKSFTGMSPTKDGLLEFPIKLKNGQTHDISELSSGEKEVLFGYLRLRNSAPKNSVILIDEPELHLNPKLAKKLPEFYYETIGKELNNQIWLVTHSDAILKEVVGNLDYSVYHMFESSDNGENQARKISFSTETEAALIDLIGEFSTYVPGNKIVIFEGEDSDFDETMTNTLFPEFKNHINSISAGSKTNVSNVQSILKAASEKGLISKKFFSIVDKDSDEIIKDAEKSTYSWDVYHIENYLLDEKFILMVLNELGFYNDKTEDDVNKALIECAEQILTFHIEHEFNQFVKREILDSIKTKINDKNSLVDEYYNAVEMIIQEIDNKKNNILSKKKLILKEKSLSNKYRNALKDDSWKSKFNGRDILKRFIGTIQGIKYELFRNLIISKMKSENYKPLGMKNVIDTILNEE